MLGSQIEIPETQQSGREDSSGLKEKEGEVGSGPKSIESVCEQGEGSNGQGRLHPNRKQMPSYRDPQALSQVPRPEKNAHGYIGQRGAPGHTDNPHVRTVTRLAARVQAACAKNAGSPRGTC
jgi:hypothetical protein